MKTLITVIMALFAIAFTCSLAADETYWSRFRGPNGEGKAPATPSIPTEWTEQNFLWKKSLPGEGHSSPVLWADKLFITSSDAARGIYYVTAMNALSGEELWQKALSFIPFRMHKFNSFASSSAAADAERIYVTWSSPNQYTLAALDQKDGTVRWKRELGRPETEHGPGASPMVYGNLVILQHEMDEDSYLLAVEAATGETVWKTPRRNVRAAYCTPCVFETEQGKELLLFTSQGHGISAIDPVTGELVWEKADVFDKRSVSSPVVAGGLIFGSCGSGAGGNYLVAVRPGDGVTGKAPEVAYELRREAPYVPTSVARGDMLFLFSDTGIATCIDAPTGKVHWGERVGSGFFGSPILVGDRIFCATTAGEVIVLKASEDFQLLARNDMKEPIQTTPAVGHGRMFIRAGDQVISVGTKN